MKITPLNPIQSPLSLLTDARDAFNSIEQSMFFFGILDICLQKQAIHFYILAAENICNQVTFNAGYRKSSKRPQASTCLNTVLC